MCKTFDFACDTVHFVCQTSSQRHSSIGYIQLHRPAAPFDPLSIRSVAIHSLRGLLHVIMFGSRNARFILAVGNRGREGWLQFLCIVSRLWDTSKLRLVQCHRVDSRIRGSSLHSTRTKQMRNGWPAMSLDLVGEGNYRGADTKR